MGDEEPSDLGDAGGPDAGDPSGTGRWMALSVDAPPRGEELLLAEALRRLGGRGIQREGGRVVAYFPPGRSQGDLVREATAALRPSTSGPAPWVRVRALKAGEERGLWQLPAEPRQVSERIWVAGAGGTGAGDAGADDAGAAPPSPRARVVVRLRPGPAFGNADHPTTRSCLRLLDRLLEPGDRVLDVGAGSGILSIAAVLLGARNAVALEADGVACRAARENLEVNGVQGRVVVQEAEADPAALRSLGRTVGPFDAALANIETGTLLRLIPALTLVLARDGWLVLAGIPRGEAPAVRAAAKRAGLEVRLEEPDQGWWSAALTGR